eukprot:6166390-Pleurochrysis_carterae.AAC.1
MAAGAELDQGANTVVRVRAQMRKRLTAWQSVLANTPGASVMTALAPEAPRSHAADDQLVWRIVGDAAGSDDGAPCPGLG